MKPILMLFVLLIVSSASFAGPPDSPDDQAMARKAFGKLPLYFIENQGQIDNEEVAYYVKGSDKTLYFTSEGITFSLTGNEGDEKICWIVRLDFVGMNPDSKPKGQIKQKAVFSYFKGQPEDWNTGIPTYSELVYEDLWPGIDLVYSGTVNQLKYEFRVKPGADPDCIRLAYHGATDVSVKETGALEVMTPIGGFEDDTPYAYQMIEGERKEVSMRYVLEDRVQGKVFSYGFALGLYDPTKSIILDPAMLVYCGYIGGMEWEECEGIAVDDYGNAYVVGSTMSDESSFPVKVGPNLLYNNYEEVFVAKINAQGTDLEYCGYIGGVGSDGGMDIAVDLSGNAYVTGYTYSDESSFPVKLGPDLTFSGSKRDAFVAKVNPQGTGLDYCGYIGGIATCGPTGQIGTCIAVDSQGCAYVVGWTEADESTFPVKVGPDLTHNGGRDGFVAKVNAQGTDFEYCGYIGGSEMDITHGIAVDGQGNAYVVGETDADESTFPVKVGPDLTHNGGREAFVAKVNTQGTGLDYCGYIGGEDWDHGEGVAVDQDGNTYVVGVTSSDESSFPVVMGPDLTYNGGFDTFVAKVNSQGTELDYCGYIGGSKNDHSHIGRGGIVIDEDGNAYITASTKSDESSFPVILGPDLTHNSPGLTDAFVARVNSKGTKLDYCGYIGGDHEDEGRAIAIDAIGNIYAAGFTYSSESTFPKKVGPDLTYNGGSNDAFVAKVMRLSLMADIYELSESTGGTINFTLDAGAWNANRNYLLLGSVTGTEPGTPLPGGKATLPLNWDNFTNVIINMVNSSVFTNFQGKLDGQGNGTAQLNLPPVPGTAGLTMYYAFALNNPWDFASNPVPIEIVP